MNGATSPAEMDFEKAVEEVESIIERIENGEVGLERSLAEYERGSRLLASCRDWLTKAEQRVRDLTAEMKRDTRSTGPGGAGVGAGPSDPSDR